MIQVEVVSKTFVMHSQCAMRFPVLTDVSLSVRSGECVVLRGPSGAGKSTLLRMVYGNYRCDAGRILVRDGDNQVDVACATPRRILALRRNTLGYVSQFLRVIPRIGARDIVAEAGRISGVAPDEARRRAEALLERLNIPARLWDIAPATFSGGEQQRVNIARGFITDHPILLLDEPTASLDAGNRAVVEDLINEKKRNGAALLAILHDEGVRDRVADRICEIPGFPEGEPT